jgi:hypothetical protein
MNDVPIAHAMPALPEWQLEMACAVLSLIALGTFATLLWRMVRAYRVRRTLRCPVKETDAHVTLHLDPVTGTPTEVTSCSLLHPASDVECSQSCLHPPKELHPHPGA